MRVINSEAELEFIDKNNLIIKALISIPRANSTIIELILGLSSSVTKIIHEPFHEFGYYDAEIYSGYQKILSIVNTVKNKRSVYILKDMAHWLIKKEIYKNFLNNISPPVILLIKNPFLSIESKIKKLLKDAGRKDRVGLNNFLLPFIKQLRNDPFQNSRKALKMVAVPL